MPEKALLSLATKPRGAVVLELLKFEPGAPLELSTDGTVLTIRRATDPGREGRLQKSLAKVNRKHGKALKRLGE